MSRYARLYKYWLTTLENDEYHFLACFNYETCHVDYTSYPRLNTIKLSEVDSYARSLLPLEMSQASMGLSSIWSDSSSVQEMFEMLKLQAKQMGLSDEPRIDVLAANLAYNADI